MKRIVYVSTAAVVALLVLAIAGMSSDSTKVAEKEEVKHAYIGAKKCKICHKEEYKSWEMTGHAKAWDLLKPEEQKNEECVGCHSTGVTPKGKLLTGVQCEACHGAGDDYKKKSIMEDRELSIKNGLIIPDSTLCVSCHNEKSPTFKSFDYAKYRGSEKGIHKLFDKTNEAEEKKAEEDKD